MAEVEQHVQNNVGLPRVVGKGGAVNKIAIFYFGGSSSTGLLTVSEGDRAGRPLTCCNVLDRENGGGAGRGGVPSSVLGDGVMSLGSGWKNEFH